MTLLLQLMMTELTSSFSALVFTRTSAPGQALLEPKDCDLQIGRFATFTRHICPPTHANPDSLIETLTLLSAVQVAALPNAKQYYDTGAQAYYQVSSSTWASGDTRQSAARKGGFIKKLGLAGAMFWEVSSSPHVQLVRRSVVAQERATLSKRWLVPSPGR